MSRLQTICLDRDFDVDFHKTLHSVRQATSEISDTAILTAYLDTPSRVSAFYILTSRIHLPFALRIPFGLQRWLKHLESQGADAKIRAYALRLYYDAIDVDIA